MAREKNEEIKRRLVEALGLASGPVAVTYSNEPDPGGDSRKRYACVALKHAFRGETVNLSRKGLVCMGAVHWLGFMDVEELLVAFLVMLEKSFEDAEAARRWFRSVPTPPFGRAEHVVLGPLGACEGTPDLVAVLANPPQAESILSLLTFSNGNLSLEHRFTATCQGVITNPIVTGKPSICIPDAVSRRFAKFADDDVIVSMPYAFAEEIVKCLPDWTVDMDELIRLIVDLTRKSGEGKPP